ncbi:Ribonuclease H [Abeliophyllum distichum]|uniref:Ribonuclease H n=1 Tax=Abeliophyllum distichum TaxID=126358 RepID=A0ABD1NR74_9LAMI
MLYVETEFPTRNSDVEDLGRLDPRSDMHERKAEPVEKLELIEVDLNHPDKVLPHWERTQRTNIEGINPKISCYRLNTSPDVKPRQQRRHPLNSKRYEALAKEVDKLLKCDFIRESLYPQWVANPVLGKFLGYMVHRRGIEANPEKIRALQEMRPPTKIKEVQSLTGRIAALSRLVSKSTDKCKPFFDALRGGKEFKWGEECQLAFEELKRQLAQPPLLSKPLIKEVLTLYLALSKHSISSVLIRTDESVQHPVYYVSQALHDAELNYTPMEKIDICPYHPGARTQCQKRGVLDSLCRWIINRNSRRGWVVLMSPDLEPLCQSLRFDFHASNNMAEYEALIVGLGFAKSMGAFKLLVNSDS